MDDAFHKLGIVLVGLLGTLLSFVIDNNDHLFNMARWIPIALSSAYVVWKWIMDIKKKK